MNTKLKKLILTSAALVIPMVCAIDALALPALQLDIVGGVYDGSFGVESTMTSSDVFTLQAFLAPDNKGDNLFGDTYYLSIAVVPQMAQSAGGNYGSFTVDGTSVAVTAGMVYGTPPLDTLYPDLGSHGIYSTYYKEISFTFDGTMVGAYNVQDNTVQNGTSMYVMNFNFDVTGLASSGLELHFDLYNENLITKKKGVDYSTQFAPYSHDAGTTKKVPEPGTLLLLGSGLLGFGILRRRQN